jgi:rhodanese-related sulfurtransferase
MSDNQIINLGPLEFSQKLKEDTNGIILDIRTSEYKTGHIPNSILINIYEPTFIDDIQKLDRNKNYYLYCRSGNRSIYAAQIMNKLGFNKLYNLTTGIINWSEPLEN